MEKKNFLTLRRCLVLIFLVVFSFIMYINYRGSYLEYQELGQNYLQIFLRRQNYLYIMMGINFIVIYIIMYFSGRRIKKNLKIFFEQEKKEMPTLPNKSIALVFSIIESIVATLKFSPIIILCISNTSFGENVPIFNLDISFFMFIAPLIKMFCKYFIFICLINIIYSFGYYILVFRKYFDGIDKETLMKSDAIKSLYRSVKLIAIGLSLNIFICSMDVVYDNFLTTDTGIRLAGSGIVDSTIKYWGYNILAVIFLLSIFRAINCLKKEKQSSALKSLVIVPIYLVILFFVMLIFDLIFVRPNEFDKERKYIEQNMSATKKAYGIECEVQNIDYTGTIGIDEVEKNSDIINNTIIVDKQTVLSYLKENQTETGYYTYRTAKVSNYMINGVKKLFYVSPREITNSRRTYNSKTYEYTHGYGLIFTSATEVTENGTLKFIQSGLAENDEQIKITTPQLYYGLETNSLVITNAKNKKEFDYSIEGNEYEGDYQGNGGLKLGFLDRLIVGIKQRNIDLPFSTSVTKESNVLINRNIIKRAKTVLPDVVYDEDPYTVVDSEGNIFWVIDAYTISSSYPYSTYTDIEYNGQRRTINYIRNSIKVIVNAYDGDIKYYITDRSDPIAMGYRKIYPELFQDLDKEIASELQEQFIYPKILYDVQAKILEEYHNTKADVLYRSDDSWEKAIYKNSQNTKKKNNILDSYYTMTNNDKIGLIQIYTPKGKQNINAYLIGIIENGENKLILKRLNSSSNILGPNQLDTKISQDETIKRELNSLVTTGSKITKNMIIVPIEDTLLYIEPVYQTLINETNLPVLKKVIVASGNKVAIGNSLGKAIENLISQYAVKIEIENTDDINGLIDTIIKANDNLSSSLSTNNWELMGNDIKKLQELILNLKEKVKEEKQEEDITTEKEEEDTELNVVE